MAIEGLRVPLLKSPPCMAHEGGGPVRFEAKFLPPNQRLAWRALGCIGALVILVICLLVIARMVFAGASRVSYSDMWLVIFLSAPVSWFAQRVGWHFLDLRLQACFLVVTVKNIGS